MDYKYIIFARYSSDAFYAHMVLLELSYVRWILIRYTCFIFNNKMHKKIILPQKDMSNTTAHHPHIYKQIWNITTTHAKPNQPQRSRHRLQICSSSSSIVSYKLSETMTLRKVSKTLVTQSKWNDMIYEYRQKTYFSPTSSCTYVWQYTTTSFIL